VADVRACRLQNVGGRDHLSLSPLFLMCRVSPDSAARFGCRAVGMSQVDRVSRVRRMSEDELRRSEARFRALAEASPAAIFIAEDRRLIYANPTLRTVTGRPREQLIGTDPLDLLHPADRETVEARLALLERGQLDCERHDVRIRTAGGSDRWIDLTISAVSYEGRSAVLGTGIDISHRRQLEAGMHQRQQFEALGRLTGGVAHDCNSLLLVITGHVERLLDRLQPGDALRETVEAIERATRRAAAQTEHLLAFGRRQGLVARSVDIGAIITELAPRLRAEAGDRVRPVLRLADRLPAVHVDRLRLEQVLLSLFVNGRDAMPEGGDVVIMADVVPVDDAMREGRPWLPQGGTWVRLRITDSGPGIPIPVPHGGFEPFFTTKRPGARLGLSTVYGIVKQSGGYVWIETQPGAGTCVTVLLPPGDDMPKAGERSLPTPPARPLVLLVEDQDAVRDLLTTVLQRNGFDVMSAPSGEAALELASGSSFDVLLTDVVLPGMTGLDVARRIRLQSPGTRVLFMSGYTGDAVLDMAEFGGECAFIQKPFASKALIARLRSVLTSQPDEPGLSASSNSG
jgi:two-component system, cell cycle sensor histidine kinase and response regulator CckA